MTAGSAGRRANPASGDQWRGDAHLRFLEAMDRIERAIRSSDDLETILGALLDATLDVFDCDRAWIATPLDPDAETIRSPLTRSRPEYEMPMPPVMPMIPALAAELRRALEADGPIAAGEGYPDPIVREFVEVMGMRSVLMIALRPTTGPPWGFGLHQCSRARIWTEDEEVLLQEISRRLGDTLSTVLEHRKVQESEQRFRALFDQSADAALVLDDSGRIVDANPKACRQYGYPREELVGASLSRLAVDSTLPGAPWPERPVGNSFSAEQEHRHKDGSIVPVELSASIGALGEQRVVIAFARDVSERRKAQAEHEELELRLRHAQKMEAVGQLAGGIAHDFNNLLTALRGSLDRACQQVQRGDSTASILEALEIAQHCTQRASQLTRQLLAFGRQDVAKLETVDLNATLSNLRKMLDAVLPESIALELALEPELLPVRADLGQLEQILVNLAVNARDAMPDGGTLSIATANVGPQELRIVPEQVGPFAICLTVSDDGCGMDERTAARAFEPFFTTKPVGAGAGLGLASCYALAERMGGAIELDTAPGRGASFRLYFPAAPDTIRPATPIPSEAVPVGGTETILLCEDHGAVRKLVSQMLTESGYRVLAASEGQQALELAANHAGPIALLITDVIMPGQSGARLAEQLTRTRPELRTLFVSGYTSNQISRHGVLDAGVHFLAKPFAIEELLRCIRGILDQV